MAPADADDTRVGAAAPAAPTPPSGQQFRLVHDDQEVVVTEVGATLRSYRVGGQPVILGFDESEPASYGMGQMMMPWPGRVGDGRYRWGGAVHQLPIDEPELGNAIHGLVRWARWTAEPTSASRLVMRHRLTPGDGYPFSLDLALTFELGDTGLGVTVAATNAGTASAPFGAGAHPYLTVGTPVVDSCRLGLPASTVLLSDDRNLPTGRAAVGGTRFDFRQPRPCGDIRLDTAFTDLARDPDGLARVSLEGPDGRRLMLWLDQAHPWVLVFTGDVLPPERRRRGIAVEPMTCPPDAFRSGTDLITLEPGDSTTARWGLDVTGFRR
ncbi:MAG: aldose 1-epimerase family protein [Candidatus Dormibacteria bacterium]